MDWCWYYILFALSYGIFLFRGLLSFLMGEIELDFDVDGNIDSDISGLLSFKGLLHFIMGFSTYLSVIGFIKTKSLYVLYSFTVIDYVWAIALGLGTTVLLYYTYKFVMKADHYNNEEMNLDGMKGQIIVDEGDGTFQVNVSTPQGVRKVVVRQMTDWAAAPQVGDYATLHYGNDEMIYYI